MRSGKFIIGDIYLKFNTHSIDSTPVVKEHRGSRPGRIVESSNLRGFQNKVLRSQKLAHPSSQEATSFRSLLMFRLFFLAYLQVEHILLPTSFRHLPYRRRRILRRENRDAKDDVVTSHGKLFMIPDARVCSRYH